MSHQKNQILFAAVILCALAAVAYVIYYPPNTKAQSTNLYIDTSSMSGVTMEIWYSNDQTGIENYAVEQVTFHYDTEQYTTRHAFLFSGSEVTLKFSIGNISVGSYVYPQVNDEVTHFTYTNGEVVTIE